MRNEIFLDTSYAIAIVSPRDQLRRAADFWSERIKNERITLLTTQPVMLEIGNALAKTNFRQIGIGLLKSIENDANITIISLTDELYDKAFALFRSRSDKEWGLIDCVSFVVMRERNIDAALTADTHFAQAGFRALLTE